MGVKAMHRVSVGDFRIGKEEREAVLAVLDSARLSEGKKVQEFENAFARFVGTKYAVATSSGTGALLCSIAALKNHRELDIREGSKVITTPLTYVATSNAIVLSGLEPVYVDVDPMTFGITPEAIRAHLEEVDDPSEYSFILPVHLMGYPCDMDGIQKVAREYSLQVFEDSAQAHGSVYKGRRTGSLSLLSDFSFYIAHNIQVGEMGAVTTNDREIWRLVKKLKANGRVCDCPICTRLEGTCPRVFKGVGNEDRDPRFTHDLIGYNFKTTEFQAALGLCQLKKAEWITERRRENVRYLNEQLEEFSDVLQLPLYSDEISYLAYPVVLRDEKISRRVLRERFEKRGVETRPLFGCIPTQQPAYGFLREQYEGRLPNAEHLGSRAFYVGCHQFLEREDLDYLIEVIKSELKRCQMTLL
jgi:dTDP-4-amino-4,6-dideoxygalactose transaminase